MKNVLIISLLFATLSSCWPTVFMNPKDSNFPEEWKKFYIAPLEMSSATAPASYPVTLSESLRTGIQNNTRLKLASKLDDAEVQITGIITGYSTSPVAIQQNDNAAKNRLTITVNYTINTPTKGLEEMKVSSTRFSDYDSSQQLVDVENKLIEEINQQLVQDLINKLLSNW
jgi:outer membrane lipopolysaccharide assembly protein LptE/RlpB